MPLTPQQARNLAQELLGDEDSPDVASHESNPALPQQIGRCRILRVIATGGMGVVYEAEQSHPKRVVALKVLKRGLTSPSALRRFEHEAQILARLRHEGIAHIYEAGMHDDPGNPGSPVPYFAMEFVPNALSIGQFAENHKLSMRARLELFAEVCDAVHHGHQKGIIHRDLKPANILVDETARVKIIDFGIACATDADIALTTLQTDVRELIGTLQYMSPEQCAGDPHDLDIRSDIYSLGMVLYELLCGQLPYDLSDTALPHATRMIQEQQAPRPSTISRTLRGDVEAILLKALQKDRAKRYQSAADLYRDIRRYLQGEPIEARALSRWAMMMRSAARHPVITTTAACLMIALLTLGATSLSVWYLNLRPHHIELTADGREAWLMSVRSNILHTWSTEAQQGISFAELVKRPAEHGSGHLALIGYSSAYENPYPGELCAFDISNDRDHPIWTARIRDEDIPGDFRDAGYASEGFGVVWCQLLDVFPERAGVESVVYYQHGPGSAACIRIYDSDGELLYQLWHDGSLGDGCYWMSAPRLLVLCGFNSEVPWPKRAHEDAKHVTTGTPPIVVLAVKPTVGHIADAWTSSSQGGDLETLEWYKCLLPPIASDVFTAAIVMPPFLGEDPDRSARLGVKLRSNPTAWASWLIDETGTVVPDTLSLSDAYKMLLTNETAPSPNDFLLQEMPPIVSSKAQSD